MDTNHLKEVKYNTDFRKNRITSSANRTGNIFIMSVNTFLKKMLKSKKVNSVYKPRKITNRFGLKRTNYIEVFSR